MYEAMKTRAGELYDRFNGSRGHVGTVDMWFDHVMEQMPGIDYTGIDNKNSTIGVKTLFDTGSDGGAMTSSLYENHDITNLDKRVTKNSRGSGNIKGVEYYTIR